MKTRRFFTQEFIPAHLVTSPIPTEEAPFRSPDHSPTASPGDQSCQNSALKKKKRRRRKHRAEPHKEEQPSTTAGSEQEQEQELSSDEEQRSDTGPSVRVCCENPLFFFSTLIFSSGQGVHREQQTTLSPR